MARKIHLTVDPTQLRTMAIGVAVLAKLGEGATQLLRDTGMPLGNDPAGYALRLSAILETMQPGVEHDISDLQQAEESTRGNN